MHKRPAPYRNFSKPQSLRDKTGLLIDCRAGQAKPPAVFLPGVLLDRDLREEIGSEVALNADVQGDGVLVLELVGGARLGSRSRQYRSALELLVEAEVHDFSRERQILDGSPAGDDTGLIDIEVRVTNEVRAEGSDPPRVASNDGSAKLALGRVGVKQP